MNNEEQKFQEGAMKRLMRRENSSINISIVKSASSVQIETNIDVEEFSHQKAGRLSNYRLSEAIAIVVSQLESMRKALIERSL